MSFFRKKLLKMKLKFIPASFTSQDMLYYLRAHRINIGEGCRFYRPSSMVIDTSRPCLLRIGSYVKITAGVIILAHDYSRSVLRRAYGEIIGEARQTIIGDNVFIGMNAIILAGSHIGSNVIVGAGSVVHGEIPDNCVIAGNPAKVICSLEQYYHKRQGLYINEAKEYARLFTQHEGRKPLPNDMHGFWPIFMERNEKVLLEHGISWKLGGDNADEVLRDFLKTEPIYTDFDSFLDDALSKP